MVTGAAMKRCLDSRVYWSLTLAILLLWGLGPLSGFVARAAETIPGIEAEIAFRSLYAKEKKHKAIAISPAGAWLMVSGLRTAEKARQKALRDCAYWLRKTPWGRDSKCQIFALDDKIVWSQPMLGPPLGEPLPPPDVPLGKARKYFPDNGKVRGFVLALHGCGKPWAGPMPFEESWFYFFRARGLQVFYPNSYDDPMPNEKCGWADPAHFDDVTRGNKTRIAQAKRSIGELRKRNPEVPIYIWSHSGGGNIAQSLDDDIAGMFIVGTKCGVGFPTLELVRPKVPVLFIFGADDDHLVKGRTKITPKLINEVCGSYYRSKTRKWVVASESGHLTTIWRQNVLDAVSAMLGEKSFQLKPLLAEGALQGEARRKFDKEYRLLPVKKAFVIGPDGSFSFSSSWNSQEDAIQHALYECARRLSSAEAVASYAEGGIQPCRLYAVGDKVVATE